MPRKKQKLLETEALHGAEETISRIIQRQFYQTLLDCNENNGL